MRAIRKDFESIYYLLQRKNKNVFGDMYKSMLNLIKKFNKYIEHT